MLAVATAVLMLRRGNRRFGMILKAIDRERVSVPLSVCVCVCVHMCVCVWGLESKEEHYHQTRANEAVNQQAIRRQAQCVGDYLLDSTNKRHQPFGKLAP